MAAIFPPSDKGGVAPGPGVANAYTPTNPVVGGEGPLYIAPDCTTILTAEQLNAITSEILAAVDKLGFAYNSAGVTNLGDALAAMFAAGDAQAVKKSGDAMTGPLILSGDPTDPNGAATKAYADTKLPLAGGEMTGPIMLPVGDPTNDRHAASKEYVDNTAAGGAAELASKVARAGDTMMGTLVLAHSPINPLEAATKAYVDAVAGTGTGGSAFTGDLLLTGATGTTGMHFTDADLFFGTRRADPLAGPPTNNRWVFNDKADATGTDVAAIDEFGNMKVSGTFNLTGAATMQGNLHVVGSLDVDTNANVDGTLTVAGASSLAGDVTISKALPGIILNRTSAAAAHLSAQRGGLYRWSMHLGTVDAESTGNAGSNFALYRYNDAGVSVDAPFSINRATGSATLSAAPFLPQGFVDVTGTSNIQLWNNGGILTYRMNSGTWKALTDTTMFPFNPLQNGYTKLANGVIIQWGQGAGYTADYWQALPIAFPGWVAAILAIPINTVTSGQDISITMRGDYMSNQFVAQVRSSVTGGTINQHNSPFFFIAIGW